MQNFDRMELLTLDGPICPDINDISTVLANAWFIMLLVCLILAVGFFLLKKPRFGLLFTLYITALLLALILNPADQCGLGGLFSIYGSGYVFLGTIAVLIVGSFLLGITFYLKTRKQKSSR